MGVKKYEIQLAVSISEEQAYGKTISKLQTIEQHVRVPERLVNDLEKRLLDHLVTVKNGIKDDAAALK